MMDPVLEELGSAAEGLTGSPSLPLVSNLTGRVLGSEEALDSGYWRRQARSAVRFGAGVRTLHELGASVLVEVGPRAVLGPLAALSWPAGESGPALVTSLGREAGFVSGVSGAYEAGLPVSFRGLYAGERRRRVSLPTYPFQRERYWVKRRRSLQPDGGHPLLGIRRELASGEVAFEAELTASSPAWLGDHRVFGQVLAPGSYYAAQAIAASGSVPVALEEVRIERPLLLASDEAADNSVRLVQLVLRKEEGSDSRSWEVFSRGFEEEDWVLHAAGQVMTGSAAGEEGLAAIDPSRLREEFSEVAVPEFYRYLAAAGIQYGPTFAGVSGLWSGVGEAVGEVCLPEDAGKTGDETFPSLLDACFQILGGVDFVQPSAGEVWLPIGWDRLWLRRSLPRHVFCHVRSRPAESEQPEVRKADFWLYTPGGEPLGRVEGFTLQRASRTALLSAAAGVDELFYELVWRETSGEGDRGRISAAFLGSPGALASGAGEVVGEHAEAEELEVAEMAALGEGLEGVARAYALRALEDLGWGAPGGCSGGARGAAAAAPGRGGTSGPSGTAAGAACRR